MSLIASLVASSNLFCIILYLSIAVLFAGNKSTTTTTVSLSLNELNEYCPTWKLMIQQVDGLPRPEQNCDRHYNNFNQS